MKTKKRMEKRMKNRMKVTKERMRGDPWAEMRVITRALITRGLGTGHSLCG
jgi:hypothetical protein